MYVTSVTDHAFEHAESLNFVNTRNGETKEDSFRVETRKTRTDGAEWLAIREQEDSHPSERERERKLVCRGWKRRERGAESWTRHEGV